MKRSILSGLELSVSTLAAAVFALPLLAEVLPGELSEGLPDGYETLPFVVFSGRQYVDTLIMPKSKAFGFDLDFVCDSEIRDDNAKYIFGSSKVRDGYWGGITLSTWRATPGGQMTFCGKGSFVNPMLTPGTRQQLSLRNGRYWTSNGSGEHDLTGHTDTGHFCGNVYLGAINTDEGDVNPTKLFSGRVYRLTLYDGSTMVADYVPAISQSGDVGFYDVAGTNKFIVSATGAPLVGPGTLHVSSAVPGIIGFSPTTTSYRGIKVGAKTVITACGKVKDSRGDFVCTGWKLYNAYDGSLIDSQASRRFVYILRNNDMSCRVVWQWARYAPSLGLPADYAPVEFVASSGSQFVDTGITPDETTRVVCDMRYPNGLEDKDVSMGWGNESKGSESGDTFFWGYRKMYEGYFAFSVDSVWNVVSTGIPVDNKRHVFDLGPGAQKLDGVTYATGTPGRVKEGHYYKGVVPHIMLFGTSVGWNSNGDLTYFASSVEIYGVQIYQNDELVADLCPAICLATSAEAPDGVGFYDRVRKVFLTGRDLRPTGALSRLKNGDLIPISPKILPGPSGLVLSVY